MMTRYTRLAAAVTGLLLVLSSCYLPAEFHISYHGNLIHAGVLSTLADGEVDADDEAEKVAAIERDLARDPAFATVKYLGRATFAVTYDRRGNIYRPRYFTFVRQNSLILSISYVETNAEITVAGGAVPSSHHQQLTDLDVVRPQLWQETRDEQDADTLGRGEQYGAWPLVDQCRSGAEPPRRALRETKILDVEGRECPKARLGSEQRQGPGAERDHEEDGERRAIGWIG